jgi:NADH-quinone oxidoreductase subunit N
LNDTVARTLVQVFPVLGPEMALGLAACFLFVGGPLGKNRRMAGLTALLALAVAGVLLAFLHPQTNATDAQYASPIIQDGLALILRWMALAGGAVLVLMSWDEVPDSHAGEYLGCLLVIVAGLSLTGLANDLVMLFLSLELTSIPTYILLYLPRQDRAAQEAALKYFLLSVFSSGFLLFGFSYLYGLAGTTNVPALLEALVRDDPSSLPPVVLVALVMVVAGLGFRITAVPFHFYAPDVYQGAPTAAVALLAFVPKAAGFAALIRVLGFGGISGTGHGLALGDQVPILFWILAAVTMSLGNMLALLQNNVKRLLAYSSVAHSGYMLMGLAFAQPLAASPTGAQIPGGVQAILFYLMAYGAMTIGAFALLGYLSSPDQPVETEEDLAGLSQQRPGAALLMALFLFSLIGIPLTGGFAGKLFLFFGALGVEGDNAGLFRWLAFVAAINAAIGAWYYLRIIAKMYLQPTLNTWSKPPAWPILTSLWACAALTLILGLYPNLLLSKTALANPPPPGQASAALSRDRDHTP